MTYPADALERARLLAEQADTAFEALLDEMATSKLSADETAVRLLAINCRSLRSQAWAAIAAVSTNKEDHADH